MLTDPNTIHITNPFPDWEAYRSRLGIMSQDCLFFIGNVRTNLDPWGLHPDAMLLESLQQESLGLGVGLHRLYATREQQERTCI